MASPSAVITPHIHTLLFTNLYFLPVVSALIWMIYQRFFSPLARIPGPFWASITSWWIVQETRKKKINRKLQELHKQYGAVVRVAPNEVSVADPPAVKTIYGPGGGFRKSDWYSVWQGTRKFDLFAERSERVHGQQRKKVSRAYAMETLKDLEPYVDNMLHIFMRKMDDQVDQPIDLAKWVQLFAFDVIGEITWSTCFNFMENGKDDGTFQIIYDVTSSGAWLGYVPYFYHIHEFLKPYIGNWIGVNARHGGIRDFAIKATAERSERPVEKNDIVGRLLEKSAQKPEEFTYTDVVSMVTSNVNAGSDTSAISMRAIIYYLLKFPQTKRKLIDEIDGLRRRGQLNDPVQYSEALKMTYLQAVIYEALRIHPAVGTNLARVVPVGGVQITEHYIPAGNVVGANAWVVHQNKEVFGEDAEQFRPERWLKGDTSDMLRLFLTFGSGSRACVGRNVSWLEMSKLIPTLFLKYDIDLVDPEQVWEEECVFFVLQHNFKVKMKKRNDPATEA